jgi:hypothetical protein
MFETVAIGRRRQKSSLQSAGLCASRSARYRATSSASMPRASSALRSFCNARFSICLTRGLLQPKAAAISARSVPSRSLSYGRGIVVDPLRGSLQGDATALGAEDVETQGSGHPGAPYVPDDERLKLAILEKRLCVGEKQLSKLQLSSNVFSSGRLRACNCHVGKCLHARLVCILLLLFKGCV